MVWCTIPVMQEHAVPVSMGSPRFQTRDVGSCLVTVVWFPPGAVLEPHAHDRPTFAVILSGGFELAFGNPAMRRPRLPCPAGTVLTQPAGETHANYIADGGAAGVVLQPDDRTDALPEPCTKLLARVHHFRDGPIAAKARQLAREMTAPDDLTPLAVESLAWEMLAEAARLEARGALRGEAPRWLHRAVEFVHHRYRESLRIDEVAQAAGVHPAHLAAVFRKVHRVPLGTYMRRLRVEWAADRLIDTEEPLAVIAAKAGFADQAHLTRCFKRVTATTPALYRRIRRRSTPQ